MPITPLVFTGPRISKRGAEGASDPQRDSAALELGTTVWLAR
jgi:hypothetical protein